MTIDRKLTVAIWLAAANSLLWITILAVPP